MTLYMKNIKRIERLFEKINKLML